MDIGLHLPEASCLFIHDQETQSRTNKVEEETSYLCKTQWAIQERAGL